MVNERPHRPPILKPDESYTFRRYFELRFAPADILREFGVSLTKAAMSFVASPEKLDSTIKPTTATGRGDFTSQLD